MKTKIMAFALITAVASQAGAYNIYNRLSGDVQVRDIGVDRGINISIPINGKASCKPSAKGCSGSKIFYVGKNFGAASIFCKWYGRIGKERGNYFVIKPVPGIEFGKAGSCKIEYYRK